eukprot:TRINITY_DN3896_c0_g1_i3.p1 TRINITY_DN3896_c0_g1~~TRINITY_DN3896_c0_g1_i3.p1  ORF type:complete len:514 (+),score=96.16 TRINITY_DN3896_c0_g1_i3:1327-2868(+)
MPVSHPLTPVLLLSFFQSVMGVYDNIYHHELTLRLPWQVSARKELLIHSMRSLLYTVVFLALAGVTPQGIYAYGLAGIIVVESLLTLWDFVTEDKTRKLPATERITHTLLTLNFGAILALWMPIILGSWATTPTSGIVLNYYGLPSIFFAGVSAGVFLWSFRDFFASRRLYKFHREELEEQKIQQQQQQSSPFLFKSKGSMKFLITGGTGFLGSRLCKELLSNGHHIILLTRNVSNYSNIQTTTTPGSLTVITSLDAINLNDKIDVVINLAGEPLVGSSRWNNSYKQRLYQSRLNTTLNLTNLIKNLHHKPSLFLSSSAIGYYGASPDINTSQIITESSTPLETDSLSHDLCQKWEGAAYEARNHVGRIVLLRTGLVMGREGGFLSQMLIPFEFGVGGKMGNGQHKMPWIHIDDWMGALAFAIENESISGPINLTAPNPVDNTNFTKTLGKVMGRPTFFTLFGFQLKLIFGSQLANELLLSGYNVVPQKLLDSGFKFKYPYLEEAMRVIVKGK